MKIAQAVNKIEAQLEGREWLMGEFSIADLESYAWLAGMVELVPSAFAERPRTADWMHRIRDAAGGGQDAVAGAGGGAGRLLGPWPGDQPVGLNEHKLGVN